MNIESIYTLSIIFFIIGLIDLIFSIRIISKMDKKSNGDVTKKKSEFAKQELDNTTQIVKLQVKKTNENVKKTIKNTSNKVKKIVKKKSN